MDTDSVDKNDKTNFNNSKSNLEKIKNKYILSQIFDNLSKFVLLEIIRYNKNIQSKLDIKLNDFKEYYELYSPIVIEIIPVPNKSGKFINISDDYKSYYHIYFDNNTEETDSTSLEEEDNISKINIFIDYKIKSLNKLFDNCICIESIIFKRFTRYNIEDMRAMLWECNSLKEINLTKFNTTNVTNMSWMFFNCSSLKEVNISNFRVDNLEKMVGMFWGCKSLEEVKLPIFNDDNQIEMKSMFTECSDELKNKIKAQNNKIDDEAFQ